MHYIYYMKAQLEFTILLLHQIEKQSIDEIYEYFEGSISIDYIKNLINNADNDDKYFDTILLNYLVC
jgi:hypothetical protein